MDNSSTKGINVGPTTSSAKSYQVSHFDLNDGASLKR